MKDILPGLTAASANLLAQLAMRGLQAITEDAKAAGAALEAAIAAASAPEITTQPPQEKELDHDNPQV